MSAVVAVFAAGLAEGEGADAGAGLVGAGAGEFAATGLLGDAPGDVAALAGGDAAGDAPGDAAAFGCGAFAAGDAAGEVDGAGLVLAGDGDAALWSSAGARLPIFERSGPTLILPSKAGRSKM